MQGLGGEAMGVCAPLALGDAEGAVGAACGAGVGLATSTAAEATPFEASVAR